MTAIRLSILLIFLLAPISLSLAQETKAKGRIYKVLPHYLDQEGRHALSPSLFDRDAYQAHLRENPELCSAIRFDVQWKASGGNSKELELFVELRAKNLDPSKPLVLRKVVRDKDRLRQWSALPLQGKAFQEAGEITAWRATLWDGETFLAQKKSFLW